MTNRLAISMLITVWAILIVAGVTAYWTTRSVLLANVDAGLLSRAVPLGESDRFIVKSESGQTMQSSVKARPAEQIAPTLQSARFVTLGDGQRVRSVVVKTFHRDEQGVLEPVTVTLTEPAAQLDGLLKRLMWALMVSGCVGGIVAAFVARAVAGIALRPLKSTADTIGQIDEHNLSRRIDSSKLAPELLPVAEKLNEMLDRLELSFANRKQFIADASHELRTPVAALVTTLEVCLRRLRDAESYRQTMDTCLADARLLRLLVDALMEQARSEIGAFKEESEVVDATNLLHECAAIMRAMAEQKGVKLTDSIEESITLRIPPGRLKQAVLGLLENAIDHNRAGGSVELSAVAQSSQLRIAVRDTGPGIAPEHLPRLFEPFYRVSRARDASGHLGLGLYLVKSHLDAMNGKCSVSSEIGVGSVFEITLPVQRLSKTPLVTAVAS